MSSRELGFSTSKTPPYTTLFALHNTPCPNTTQNTKLINAKHSPNQVECKTKIHNLQTTKHHKNKKRSKGITPSKFHDYQLFPLLAYFASPNPHSPSSVRSFPHLPPIWVLFTQQKPGHRSRSQWNQYKHWKFLPFS
jgi:hypothetical protein